MTRRWSNGPNISSKVDNREEDVTICQQIEYEFKILITQAWDDNHTFVPKSNRVAFSSQSRTMKLVPPSCTTISIKYQYARTYKASCDSYQLFCTYALFCTSRSRTKRTLTILSGSYSALERRLASTYIKCLPDKSLWGSSVKTPACKDAISSLSASLSVIRFVNLFLPNKSRRHSQYRMKRWAASYSQTKR
jgi:hypothetical protein